MCDCVCKQERDNDRNLHDVKAPILNSLSKDEKEKKKRDREKEKLFCLTTLCLNKCSTGHGIMNITRRFL